MDKIAIFYHCSFFKQASSCSMVKDTSQPWPKAIPIVVEQWNLMHVSGLVAAASKIVIGINGGTESAAIAKALFPKNAELVFHGTQSKSENRTLLLIEEWVKTNPGWLIFYFHTKGLSRGPNTMRGEIAADRWRQAMMADLVQRWRQCVEFLEAGYDIVCSCWMWEQGDGTQHIPAGNFLWIASDYAATLPSILLRERIKQDGLDALSSRYEAEVYWGNGLHLNLRPKPKVKSYRPHFPFW